MALPIHSETHTHTHQNQSAGTFGAHFKRHKLKQTKQPGRKNLYGGLGCGNEIYSRYRYGLVFDYDDQAPVPTGNGQTHANSVA